MPDIEILDEVTLIRRGSYKRVRRYLRGRHPDRGILIHGITGWETVEEIDVLSPMIVINVVDGKHGQECSSSTAECWC